MRISSNTSRRARLVWEACLDLLYPRTCVSCGRLLNSKTAFNLCTGCAHGIDWIGECICPICGAPVFGNVVTSRPCQNCREAPPAFDVCRSVFMYHGVGARILHALKYEGGTWLRPQLEQIIGSNPAVMEFLRAKTLIPVPLHWRKLCSRGYNQADIIAAAIQRQVPQCKIVHSLCRQRHTSSQTMLTRRERLYNMENVFRCDVLPDIGCEIVLVDDVLTTGATLNAAVKALQEAGRLRISAFTLAHG